MRRPSESCVEYIKSDVVGVRPWEKASVPQTQENQGHTTGPREPYTSV